MGLMIFAVLVGVPLIEIAVLIKVGGLIGLWPTLLIIVFTAVAGTALMRRQGLATLSRIQSQTSRGEFPLSELFEAGCLLVGGLLLLTPGFVTDAAGLMLLLAPVRRALMVFLARRFRLAAAASGPQDGDPRHGTIDVEYEEIVDTGEATDAAASDKRKIE